MSTQEIRYEEFIRDSKPPTPQPIPVIEPDDEVTVPDQSFLNAYPIHIQWRNIVYRANKKTILNLDFEAEVGPGDILAIIGASGSGKTTFLNVLAGRYSKNEGDVLFNGQKMTTSMRRLVGFVQQDDILYKNLTVEETLKFTAKLRVPENSDAIVAEKLKELGIAHCKKNRIGAIGEKNVISGGERKRTSTALELLTNPSVLFLDEPTSGLDAKTALNLIDTLVDLAKMHRTVILTIHQPRSDIFNRFNKLMILSKGRVCFYGNRDDVLPYFASLGLNCPQYFNPADFLIDQVSESDEKTDRIIEHYKSLQKEPLKDRTRKIEEITIKTTNWFYQIWILFCRSFLSFTRDRSLFIARFVQTILMSLLFGLVYLGNQTGQKTIQNLQGSLFFILVQQGMTPLFMTLNVFQNEKKVFFKEHESKSYRISSYFLGKTFAELPGYMLFPIIFGSISYFMIGYHPHADKFFTFLLILTLIGVCSHSLGLFLSAVSPNLDFATLISPFLMTLFLLFSGFYMNAKSIPPYFIWISYISLFRYGFEILIINEFSGRTFTCEGNELVNGICPITSGEQVIQRMGFAGSNIWTCVGILVGMIFGYRILAYLSLVILTRLRK